VKQLDEATLVLGLGGNLDGEGKIVERMRKVAQAVAGWGMVAGSAVYRTAAMGPPQPDFLNAALRVRLTPPPWLPLELMTAVLEIEALLGRDRRTQVRWGPRAIDVDVLLWGPRLATWPGPPRLQVPHPNLAERRFALIPVADLLDADTEIPGTGHSLDELLCAVADQAVALTEWRLER
jgi:2-amino-4-hydroxy-6-hydroxymethyldihydropteridine diphosphokinase